MPATPPTDSRPPSDTPAQPPRRPRRWLGSVVALAITAGLVGGGYYLVKRQSAGPAAGMPGARGPGGAGGPGGPGPGGFMGARGGMAVTVGIATVQQGELPIRIEALGTVVPSQQVALTAQVGGVLQEVLFEEGQTVKKGQLLARIDPRTYEQALAQAKSQTARDQAQLAAAQQTLKRYETLWKQDSIARQDVDTQAALVKQLQATVMADQASEKAAQINLDHTRITAPLAGRIGLRGVDPGNLVAAGGGTAIASIAQITPVDVTFAVPQDRVPEVLFAQRDGRGLAVAALDRARTQTLAEGHFLTLDNSVDTATGTVKGKARFDNADFRLFPNQFVNVRLQLGLAQGVLVPVSAVRLGPDGSYVYVVDDEQVAHTRLIQRGLSTDEQVQVLTGLKAGERVVTEGGDRVKDGGRVQLASARPADGASGAQRSGWRGRRGGADAGAAAGAPMGAASGAARWRDGQGGRGAAPGASPAQPGAEPPAGQAGQGPAAPAASAAGQGRADAASAADRVGGMSSSPFESQRRQGNTPSEGGPRQLPPEIAAKLEGMSEAERQAFFAERRAAREARHAAEGGAGAASPGRAGGQGDPAAQGGQGARGQDQGAAR